MHPDTSFRPMLDRNTLHVLYCYTSTCVTSTRRPAYLALMSDEEREKYWRFQHQDLRDEYLITRVLCRTALSFYTGVRPQDWMFGRNDYGRPFVTAPTTAMPLAFNLTNSRSMVAIVVAIEGREIGIDVERLARPGDIMGIAASYFSARERADLAGLAEEERTRRFFDLWTLKESYIKAKGMGLSLPLEDFSMQFAGNAITIAFSGAGGPADPRWQFRLVTVDAAHVLALCAERIDGRDALLSVREIVPEPYPF